MILIVLTTLIVSFFLVFHFIGYLICLFKKQTTKELIETNDYDFACVVTAYKNLAVTQALVQSLLQQTYRTFHVYVIADRCEELMENENHLTVIYPSVPLNSKVKSLQLAVQKFKRSHDAVVVLDADNVADSQFLFFINAQMKNGYDIVQGKRTAKNMNTDIARLDSIGETYYDFNTREIPFAMGSSATIAGSGMAIATPLFVSYLACEQLVEKEGKVVTAEDKVLQKFVVEQGFQIAYEPRACIYDEKTETGAKIQRQRTRWFNAYFRHIGDSVSLFKKGTFNQVYFGFLSIYPPIVLMAMSSFVLMLVNIFFWENGAILLTIATSVFIFHFIYSLQRRGVNAATFFAIKKIPTFILNQLKGMIQFRKANKDFLATEHIHQAVTI